MSNKIHKILVIILVLIAAMGIFLFFQSKHAIKPVAQLPYIAKTQAIPLPWPSYGQSALGAVGYGVLAESGNQKAVPMASITKIVTALAVLRQKPLNINQQSPIITLTRSDVAIYNSYYSQDGSVAKVTAGEQISEYQALQTMLLPSANNMADSLAIWAFGSLENYLTYANNMLSQLGLNQIHVANTNGFSPQSTANVHDLVLLGETALSNPVLAQIVNQRQASVPVAGIIYNSNSRLGKNGIIGIKTGFTDEAGGCYLVADNQTIEGQKITFVGAILGAPNLKSAMGSTATIISASGDGFQKITVVRAGQQVGYYKTPWGASSAIVASKNLSLLAWRGADINLYADFVSLKLPAKSGQSVGSVSITSNDKTVEIPVVLKQSLPGPSWYWRLFRF